MRRLAGIGTTVLALLVGAGVSEAAGAPDLGEVDARPVAWNVVKILGEHEVEIETPGVHFCHKKPALKPFVAERPSKVVVTVYMIPPVGRQLKCRNRNPLTAKVHLAHPLHGRALYDGKFDPPRLRHGATRTHHARKPSRVSSAHA
jgi:hypothetical protein